MRPLGDRVIISPHETEEVRDSGLIIPDTVKEKPQKGVVLAVGNGLLKDDGERHPPEVQEGEEVLYTRYGGAEVELDGNPLVILREPDILAVLDGNANRPVRAGGKIG
jgi:chaperonin GroES